MNFEYHAHQMQQFFALPDALAGRLYCAALRQRILKISFNTGQAVHTAHPDRVFKVVVQAAVIQIDGAHDRLLPVHDHHLGVGEAGHPLADLYTRGQQWQVMGLSQRISKPLVRLAG